MKTFVAMFAALILGGCARQTPVKTFDELEETAKYELNLKPHDDCGKYLDAAPASVLMSAPHGFEQMRSKDKAFDKCTADWDEAVLNLACSRLYAQTFQKRVSDLTVAETQGVTTCAAKNRYHACVWMGNCSKATR